MKTSLLYDGKFRNSPSPETEIVKKFEYLHIASFKEKLCLLFLVVSSSVRFATFKATNG